MTKTSSNTRMHIRSIQLSDDKLLGVISCMVMFKCHRFNLTFLCKKSLDGYTFEVFLEKWISYNFWKDQNLTFLLFRSLEFFWLSIKECSEEVTCFDFDRFVWVVSLLLHLRLTNTFQSHLLRLVCRQGFVKKSRIQRRFSSPWAGREKWPVAF